MTMTYVGSMTTPEGVATMQVLDESTVAAHLEMGPLIDVMRQAMIVFQLASSSNRSVRWCRPSLDFSVSWLHTVAVST